jgi:hypothetical protein
MSEEWHKTHAVLLKSVAESQGKLLAGINALETKLTAIQVEQGKNQLKADLAHGTVLAKLEEFAEKQWCEKVNKDMGEGIIFEIGETLRELPCMHGEAGEGHKGTPPMFYREMILCCMARAARDAQAGTLGAKPSTKRKPRGRQK